MSGILKPKRQTNSTVLDQFRGRPCVLCGKPSDPAHIKSRGAGGPDDPQNIVSLCREHHSMQHQYGHIRMMEKFPPYRFHLEKMGWGIVLKGYVKMLKHPRFG